MTKLTAIGNSQGIRIPKSLIAQAKLANSELELIIVDKGLLIKPVQKVPREDWAEDIQDVLLHYGKKKDNALLSDLLDDSDLEGWEW